MKSMVDLVLTLLAIIICVFLFCLRLKVCNDGYANLLFFSGYAVDVYVDLSQ